MDREGAPEVLEKIHDVGIVSARLFAGLASSEADFKKVAIEWDSNPDEGIAKCNPLALLARQSAKHTCDAIGRGAGRERVAPGRETVLEHGL